MPGTAGNVKSSSSFQENANKTKEPDTPPPLLTPQAETPTLGKESDPLWLGKPPPGGANTNVNLGVFTPRCGSKRARPASCRASPITSTVSPLHKQQRNEEKRRAFSFMCSTPLPRRNSSPPSLKCESDSSDSDAEAQPRARSSGRRGAQPREGRVEQAKQHAQRRHPSLNPPRDMPPLNFELPGIRCGTGLSRKASEGATDFNKAYRLLSKATGAKSCEGPEGGLVPLATTIQGFVALTERRSDGKRFATKFYEVECVSNKRRLAWSSRSSEGQVLVASDSCQPTRDPVSEDFHQERRCHATLSELAQQADESFILEFVDHGLAELYGQQWYFVVMELGDRDLFETIIEEAPYDDMASDKREALHERMATRAAQMFRAVAFLHDNGFAHNDISPENFVEADGVIKLMDFGVARKYGMQFTKSSRRDTGKAKYLPMEVLRAQALGEDLTYDPRKADSSALGNTLFCMYAGSNPFLVRGRTTEVSVYEAVNRVRKNGGLRKLHGVGERLPEALLDLLENHLLVPEAERMIPREALEHPFFTGGSLEAWRSRGTRSGSFA